jgi:hypothetical protein
MYRDGALIWEIVELLELQIGLVQRGVLVRGGVTVGDAHVGAKGQGPLFGPAVARAYEIERQDAVFPRIGIDLHALSVHRSDERLRGQQNSLDYEIKVLRGLLAVGEDGTRFLDYLDRAISNLEFTKLTRFLETHAALIRKGRRKYRDDIRTLRKYEWLARYHNDRVSLLTKRLFETELRREQFHVQYGSSVDEFFKRLRIVVD